MARLRTVLIVDDTDECYFALEIALGAIAGLSLRWTPTAEQALEALAAGGYAAVITDLHLPAMDGLELVERLRRDPGLAQLPVVVISGGAEPGLADRARRAGADAFFPKPYSPAEVRRTVERLIDATQ